MLPSGHGGHGWRPTALEPTGGKVRFVGFVVILLIGACVLCNVFAPASIILDQISGTVLLLIVHQIGDII